MALKKTKQYSNGTSANYHKILSIELVAHDATDDENIEEIIAQEWYEMIIELCSYHSEDIRRNSIDAYLETNYITTNIAKTEFNSADLFTQAYNYLKTTSAFKDAEDV